MKARFVSEAINFERGKDLSAPEMLGIGNKHIQGINRLKGFAEEHGFDFFENKKKILILTIPLDLEVAHNYASSGTIWGDRGSFASDALRYKVNWPKGWEDSDTPISVRKVWMSGGKETKQNLMGRVPDMDEAIRKIKVSYPKEIKKANK